MKKKLLMILMMAVVVVGCMACGKSEGSENKSTEETAKCKEFNEKVVGVGWLRGVTGCTEYIYFNEDGSYGYYEACGNPVDDHDLYETWEYDNKNDVIRLEGNGKHETTIEYVSCDGEKLVMIIDDEERTFELREK